MNDRRLSVLTTVSTFAGTGLLLVFLLLGRSMAGATGTDHSASPDLRSPIANFTVSGTVTCEGTGLISDVEVYAWNRDKGTAAVGDVTDAGGTYSVTLEEGNYDLIFNPPCGSGSASKAYKGIAGPPDVTLDVVLSVGHSVSGTVFATGGSTPVGNVAIYAFNHDTADGFGLPPTNEEGHYCVGLITGTYDLGFTPPPCLGLGPKTEVITVTQDVSRNIILPPGITVAGRVTDGTGDPVSGVQIYARECYTWRGYGFSPSNVNGYYAGTLPQGTFGIQFLPPADQGLGPKTITNVMSTTAGCPNTRLDVMLPAGFTVSGRVTCRARPVKNVRVHADPSGPPPDCYGLDEIGTYTVDDGSFRLPLIQGDYAITFDPPPATGIITAIVSDLQIITDATLNVNLCPLFQKSVDDLFAVPSEQRTYRLVLAPGQDIGAAHLTDTLPSAVTWAGDISATSGSASYSDRTITWSGPLTTGVPLTITYGVTVTHAPRCGTAAHTDIYTDVTNDAVLDDGQGNVFTSTPAVFAIGRPFGTSSDRTFDVDLGDADNDGDLDLAVGNHGPNQVCWNNGDGTFECEDAFGGSATFDVEWGDMDGDGYLDLVVANSMAHANLVCLSNLDVTRTFTCTPFSYCSGPGPNEVCHIALGDVDCDGDLDIALGTRYPGSISAPDLIYHNNGDGTFITTTTACQGHPTINLDFGDVDDDGDLDLAIVGHYSEYICINGNINDDDDNKCTGTFTRTRWLAWRKDKNTNGLALGDANRDDILDVAVGRESYANEVYLIDRDVNVSATLSFDPVWERTWSVAWEDVDHDGDLDLASGNSYRPTVIYFNEPVTTTHGFTLTKPIVLGTGGHRTLSVAFGDVDGDGHPDLAVGSDRGQNVVYLNTLQNCVYLPIVMKGW